MNKLVITMLYLAALALCFMCVDCSCGTTQHNECTAIAHEYKPPWTEVTTSTDSDGEVSISTTHHPEEYHVICSVNGDGPDHQFDCNSSRITYYAVTNGQPVMVRTREGRWTHHRYIPSIE